MFARHRMGFLRLSLFAIMLLGCPGYLAAIDLKPEEVKGKGASSPVTILQNRYFLKALRPELGVSYGTVTNEAYTDTKLLGFRGALFFNEWLGLELQSFTATTSDSDDLKSLKRLRYLKIEDPTVQVFPDPEVNRVKKILDLSAVVAPFYGKLNFADWLIIYSDLYLTGGVSTLNTDQGDLNALSFGAGQRFYWQKALSFRIDFKGRRYTEKAAGKDHNKTTYSVDFGLSYFLF
ncbi:MAG: outer membrane beta-barrel domain-containing protein [Bdellovibrionota bacterium]|nr:MAG: outer membrane beta-barrel domain-containing protein [Pseudomonadota bacterium]